ncbi:MAG: hypothetical protein Q4F31_10690 [Eubacteriales bacterium]|nr:hypothetical protein [Eubacteriales bacterium]
MTFTNEMKEKAKKAASAEELLEMAKAEGVELSASDAELYYNFLNGSRELTDEELSQVAGGKNEKKDPLPKYKINQRVSIYFATTRSTIHGMITEIGWYRTFDDNRLIYKYRVFIEEYGYEVTLELEHFGKDVQVIS